MSRQVQQKSSSQADIQVSLTNLSSEENPYITPSTALLEQGVIREEQIPCQLTLVTVLSLFNKSLENATLPNIVLSILVHHTYVTLITKFKSSSMVFLRPYT